jgi:hypothetical protein
MEMPDDRGIVLAHFIASDDVEHSRSSVPTHRVLGGGAIFCDLGARGAQFMTPPKQYQHEIRCYIGDPDGYLVEVGQTADPVGDWSLCSRPNRVHEHSNRRCVPVGAPSDPSPRTDQRVADRLFRQDMLISEPARSVTLAAVSPSHIQNPAGIVE